MTPRPTAEVHASRRAPPSISTPAFASAKSGTTTKLVQGCRSSCSRSLGDTARSTLSLAERASAGTGDWRKAFVSAAASLDLLAPRGVHGDGDGDQDPGDGRVDPGLEHRRPQHRPHQEVGRPAPDLQPPQGQDHEHARPRQQERQHLHVVGVEERDDRQGGDVVHDREREQEDPQLGGGSLAHQGEHAQGEGGVGGDRHPPTLRRVARRVHGQVDGRRHQDPRAGRERRDPQPHLVGQLAHRHLAAQLEADDEEEEDHQPVVDPVAQVLGDAVVAEADRQLGRPELVVAGRERRVHPDERRDRRGQQEPGRPRLGGDEGAQGRGELLGEAAAARRRAVGASQGPGQHQAGQ